MTRRRDEASRAAAPSPAPAAPRRSGIPQSFAIARDQRDSGRLAAANRDSRGDARERSRDRRRRRSEKLMQRNDVILARRKAGDAVRAASGARDLRVAGFLEAEPLVALRRDRDDGR